MQLFKINIFGSAAAASVFSNKDLNDIMKIVNSLEEAVLLIKSITITVKNEPKKKDAEGLRMLTALLASSLLRCMLSGIEIIRAGEGARNN